MLQSLAMKWFLNTRMARSAELRRCACGGMSWNLLDCRRGMFELGGGFVV